MSVDNVAEELWKSKGGETSEFSSLTLGDVAGKKKSPAMKSKAGHSKSQKHTGEHKKSSPVSQKSVISNC